MNATPTEDAARGPEARFRALAPQRLECAAVRRLLPDLARRTCLDIGAPNPVFSRTLREAGGVWRTLARSPAHAREAGAFLGEPVGCPGADGSLPWADRSFDVIVVALDILGAMPDAETFVRECNRALKPSGLLILSAQARRALSIPDAIRRRRWPDAADPYAAEWNEASLYNLLKNGFDVQEVVAWSRTCLELARLREHRLLRAEVPLDETAARMRRPYWFAERIDPLCFWARGHVITLSARRRRWSNRRAPTLGDGRSIGEAVLFHPPA